MTARPLGVYVHWPFCARICPYCDFNVYKTRDVDAARWTNALLGDLRYWATEVEKRALTSLYFGGGTPSLAPPETISAVVEECARLWGFVENPEITLEANPTDAEGIRFAGFRAAGVNRLSLGVQSFDDRALQFLGRDHDAAAARAGVALALKIFPRVSFDLIYALPGQSSADWRSALRDALQIGATHLSLYQLTIEEGTAFGRAVGRGAFAPTENDVGAELFDDAQEETARAGLPAYEISNHARSGEESRHNLLYWTCGDYVGVGPGAHGRLTIEGARYATETRKRPDDYLSSVETTGTGATGRIALDREALLVEKLATGLRLAQGIALDPSDFSALGGRAARLRTLEEDGLVCTEGARVVATAGGRRVLNRILADLLG